MKKKSMQINEETHTRLNLLRAEKKFVTFDKTIQFLLKKYKEKEK